MVIAMSEVKRFIFGVMVPLIIILTVFIPHQLKKKEDENKNKDED